MASNYLKVVLRRVLWYKGQKYIKINIGTVVVKHDKEIYQNAWCRYKVVLLPSAFYRSCCLSSLQKKYRVCELFGRIFVYRKSSIDPPGGLFISNTFRGGLFNSAKVVVSVLRKERSWSSCTSGSKTNPNFQSVNKPSRISPNVIFGLRY